MIIKITKDDIIKAIKIGLLRFFSLNNAISGFIIIKISPNIEEKKNFGYRNKLCQKIIF